MRLLVLDIENSPNLAYVWGLWGQDVGLNQIVDTHSVMCFAAKWHGERGVMFHSDHHDGHDEMVRAAWALLDEADAVIHYNGRAHDIKHLRREFLLAGLGPPSEHADIDLVLTARREFKFPTNKLDHVSQALGVGTKVKHDGFELWKACMAGDDKAWRKMKRYNVQDVRLTEQVYDKLRPWIKNHPNHNLFESDGSRVVCSTCGGDDLMGRGTRRTQVGEYPRFQCRSCGSYMQGTRCIRRVHVRGR